MKRTLLKNFSVNALQLVVNQVLGLGIFFLLSTGLNKAEFGQLNLVLAILLAVFNILSFGIDQLTIKKIASGIDATAILSLYIRHVVITGLLFYSILFSGYYFFSNINQLFKLLLLVGAGKLMIFFSMPFKQAANGMERFMLLAKLSAISNMVRFIGLVVLAIVKSLSLHHIVMVFISGDMAELLLGFLLFKRAVKIPVITKWNSAQYMSLLRESLPQTGVVLITSALARFDWVFIGFMVSAVKLAEYSFAYRIFEISTLPLLAVAPLLIPRFTAMFKRVTVPVNLLKFLLKTEIIVAAFIAMALTICWAPVIDWVTAGRYGLINTKTVFMLSLCMPLLYLNNFLWTIFFAQGRMKMILTSFVVTFLVNVGGDVLLIPIFKNEGAAFAFFVACAAQSIYYVKMNTVKELQSIWQPLIFCTLCALAGGIASKMFFGDSWLALPSAALFYAIFLVLTRQVNLTDGTTLKRLYITK